MAIVLACVFFVVGISCQAAGLSVNVHIDPLTYTITDWLDYLSANVTCLVVSCVSEMILELELCTHGECSVLFSGGKNSKTYPKFKHVGPVQIWSYWNGTNTVTYFRLTILQPETKDSGTYACMLLYLDQEHMLRWEQDVDVFTVEHHGDLYSGVEEIVEKYGLIVNSVIGLPGNMLCFLVWRRHERAYNSSRFYLATLGLTNLLYVSLSLAYRLHNNLTTSRALDESALCNVFLVIVEFSRILSVPLVLGYTVERYISICHPFQRVFYCTRKRAKIVSVCLAIVTLLLTSPYYYYAAVRPIKSNCSIQNTVHMGSWMYVIVVDSIYIIGGDCVILVLNILVIVELKTGTNADVRRLNQVGGRFDGGGAEETRGGRGGGQRRNDKDNTNILLALSCYQVITTLPLSVLLILIYVYSPPIRTDHGNERLHVMAVFPLAYIFAWLFADTHHAFDILVYILTGRTFRRTLKQLLTCSHRD